MFVSVEIYLKPNSLSNDVVTKFDIATYTCYCNIFVTLFS